MQSKEFEPMRKAGVIPYYLTPDGEIKMMFMVPSDPEYGGTRPQVAKGNIDPGETSEQAALREGKEELGLDSSNISSFNFLGKFSFPTQSTPYTIDVYVAEVYDTENFGTPHFETGSVHWLTLKEFGIIGRKNHMQIVSAALAKVNLF